MNLIANIVGVLGAVTYIGFFAYKVDELPLTVIVIVCLGLMVYAFYDDTRRNRALTRARRENSARDG